MKEWIAQVDRSKEASTFERMDDPSQLLSWNRMRHYFKELTAGIGVSKKYSVLTASSVLKKIYSPWRNEMAASAFIYSIKYFSNKSYWN